MVFRLSLLPMIKIFSSLIIHIFFIVFLAVFFIAYGYMPNLHWLQIFYYLFCSMVLLIGINLITSSVVVFFRDLSGFVNIFIQFGFWLTPIFWNPSMVSPRTNIFLKLNPAYYIINGYRDSLINEVWFWERSTWTLYFWVLVVFLFIYGNHIFKKLRPHFPDVI